MTEQGMKADAAAVINKSTETGKGMQVDEYTGVHSETKGGRTSNYFNEYQ